MFAFFALKLRIVIRTWISLSTRNIGRNVFPLLSDLPVAKCYINRVIWSHKALMNLLLRDLGSSRAVFYSASDRQWLSQASTLSVYFEDEIQWIHQFRYSECRICLVSRKLFIFCRTLFASSLLQRDQFISLRPYLKARRRIVYSTDFEAIFPSAV